MEGPVKVYSSASVPAAPVEHGEGVSIQWLINREHGAPNFTMRLFEVKPGGATPLHAHAWEHEVYILEGKGVVRGAQGDTALAAGDVTFVEPGEEHQFANAGEEPFRFICVIPLEERLEGRSC